jgi:phosphatidate cytidylyltransferase
LKLGLPPLDSKGSHMLGFLYCIAVISCFVAIVVLFRHSAAYLLSVMAIVWVADIGAYFSGKAFGKRKLAPAISPGKSWEGAIGGGIAVLVLSTLAIVLAADTPWLQDTFAVRLQSHKGWLVTVVLLVLITAASIVGDLFESMLKRRAGMKDSSNLLPGHGGVLDRIDALVPVLPLAALVTVWLK